MERRVGAIIIPDTRDAISQARRQPLSCLYCENSPDSREHALPEALGGRLWAKILCKAHNNLIANRCDGPMAEQFAPLVHFLDVARHRGGRGTSFRARSDDGERVVVERGFKVRRRRLEVVQKAPGGKIKYARGELMKLDELKAAGALDKPDGPVIATLEKPPIVNFEIAVARDAERGVLKIALHFIAGFLSDVDRDRAADLLPFVLGDGIAGGLYVRTLPLEEKFFPQSWPPRHEVRTYPSDDETYVTVLLFGVHGFQVRLPVRTDLPIRYSQPLIDSVTPAFERNDHERRFGWDDRLTADEWSALRSNLAFRHDKMEGFAKWRMMQMMCMRAATRALTSQYALRVSYGDAYRAELQQEAFSSDDISRLMHWGAKALRRGQPPWAIPLDEFMA